MILLQKYSHSGTYSRTVRVAWRTGRGEEGIASGEVGCASPHNEARPGACRLLMREARSRSCTREVDRLVESDKGRE